MSAQILSVVSSSSVSEDGAGETLAQRIQRLQAEARSMSREHVLSLESALLNLASLAGEVAGGGEAYPPGVREMARRLVQDSQASARGIDSLLTRAH